MPLKADQVPSLLKVIPASGMSDLVNFPVGKLELAASPPVTGTAAGAVEPHAVNANARIIDVKIMFWNIFHEKQA
jgi:hypothetical protein